MYLNILKEASVLLEDTAKIIENKGKNGKAKKVRKEDCVFKILSK